MKKKIRKTIGLLGLVLGIAIYLIYETISSASSESALDTNQWLGYFLIVVWLLLSFANKIVMLLDLRAIGANILALTVFVALLFVTRLYPATDPLPMIGFNNLIPILVFGWLAIDCVDLMLA